MQLSRTCERCRLRTDDRPDDAKTLRIEIPPELLMRADEVLEAIPLSAPNVAAPAHVGSWHDSVVSTA